MQSMNDLRRFLQRNGSIVFILLALSLSGCNDRRKEAPPPEFDYENSDPKAVEIADQVIAAMGGLENWEKTRYVAWNCLGKRLNVWDKHTGNVRIESRASLILMNLNTRKGHAWKFTREVTDRDELQRFLDYGYEAWQEDSYWMFLPFKLKDGGVTLKYVGEEHTDEGKTYDILSLTFKNVGKTPQNKHHVYIDRETKLLARWAFYMDANDDYPRFTVPWRNYQKYGLILLSDDRGTKKHTDVGVFDILPDSVFNSPEPIDWEKIRQQIAEHTSSN